MSKWNLPRQMRIYQEDVEVPTRFSVGADLSVILDRAIITVVLFDHRYNRPHVGTAVCHPLDIHNPEIGQRLALKRAFENWLLWNSDYPIRYALVYDIGIHEAKEQMWKRLGADIWYTMQKENPNEA